jgi:hypothetical protein
MTKKHFEAIAKAIADIPSATARRYAAHAIARACAELNDRFDAKRFLIACGITPAIVSDDGKS